MKAQSAPSIPAALSLLPLLIISGTLFANPASSATEREFDAALRLRPDAVHGEQIFDTCAACHGNKGTGASDGTVPAIAGQHFRVVVWELVNFRNGQRSDPRMQHFTDPRHLSGGAQDVADVAAYVSHLQPSASIRTAAGDRTTQGAELFRLNCSSCHGTNAQGNDDQRNPRLAGQHYEYLLHRLQDSTDGQRTNIQARHDQLRQRLTPQDLSAICKHLSQLNP